MDLKSARVTYKGQEFENELDARWAIYFDRLGVKYLYLLDEKNKYSPIFYLPRVKMWAKAKAEFTKNDENFYRILVVNTLSGCIFLEGLPDKKAYYAFFYDPDGPYWDDLVISMYHNYYHDENRFYQSTGGTDPFDFSENGIFSDVRPAIFAARLGILNSRR
jgi:hypothetical protein